MKNLVSQIKSWPWPNILTGLRIILIPFVLGFLMLGSAWAAWLALGLYIIAAVTDYLDGYLARSLKQVSALGRFLDPIADKLLVAAVLLCLAGLGRLDGIWLIPAILILLREILIAGLREYLAPMNITIAVSPLAKWKTTSQLIAIGFLMIGDFAPAYLYSLTTGHILLLVAAALSIFTGWNYMKQGLKIMLEQK